MLLESTTKNRKNSGSNTRLLLYNLLCLIYASPVKLRKSGTTSFELVATVPVPIRERACVYLVNDKATSPVKSGNVHQSCVLGQ